MLKRAFLAVFWNLLVAPSLSKYYHSHIHEVKTSENYKLYSSSSYAYSFSFVGSPYHFRAGADAHQLRRNAQIVLRLATVHPRAESGRRFEVEVVITSHKPEVFRFHFFVDVDRAVRLSNCASAVLFD